VLKDEYAGTAAHAADPRSAWAGRGRCHLIALAAAKDETS
jgi:hypothetical protein